MTDAVELDDRNPGLGAQLSEVVGVPLGPDWSPDWVENDQVRGIRVVSAEPKSVGRLLRSHRPELVDRAWTDLLHRDGTTSWGALGVVDNVTVIQGNSALRHGHHPRGQVDVAPAHSEHICPGQARAGQSPGPGQPVVVGRLHEAQYLLRLPVFEVGADGSPAGKVTSAADTNLIQAFEMSRDLDATIAYAQRVNDAFRRSGALSFASTCILHQALLMLERRDASRTVVPLVDEAEGWTSPYDAVSVCYGRSCRAILALRSGDLERAQQLAEEALQVIDRTQQEWQRADLRRWLSAVPRATGDHELERRMILEAQQMYACKEIRSYELELDARLAELEEAETEGD